MLCHCPGASVHCISTRNLSLSMPLLCKTTLCIAVSVPGQALLRLLPSPQTISFHFPCCAQQCHRSPSHLITTAEHSLLRSSMAFLAHALQSLRVPRLICSSATPFISGHLHRSPSQSWHFPHISPQVIALPLRSTALNAIPLPPWLCQSMPFLCHSCRRSAPLFLFYPTQCNCAAVPLSSLPILRCLFTAPLRLGLACECFALAFLCPSWRFLRISGRFLAYPLQGYAVLSGLFLCHASQICAAHSFAMPPLLCLPPWGRWQASA